MLQVFGIPDERLGEQVCAWIKVKEGESVTVDDVKDFCKGNVNKHLAPILIQLFSRHYFVFI